MMGHGKYSQQTPDFSNDKASKIAYTISYLDYFEHNTIFRGVQQTKTFQWHSPCNELNAPRSKKEEGLGCFQNQGAEN